MSRDPMWWTKDSALPTLRESLKGFAWAVWRKLVWACSPKYAVLLFDRKSSNWCGMFEFVTLGLALESAALIHKNDPHYDILVMHPRTGLVYQVFHHTKEKPIA